MNQTTNKHTNLRNSTQDTKKREMNKQRVSKRNERERRRKREREGEIVTQ